MVKALEFKEGQILGKWTVLKKSAETKNGYVRWTCRCECGTERDVIGKYLKSGKSSSCGCIRKPYKKAKRQGVFKTKTVEYHVWTRMRDRCFNPNTPKFKHYGGRGITICERWNSFENFLEDMGERPTNRHSIERKDVNGNYEPSNCIWTTQTVQSRNQRIRTDNSTGISGVSWNKKLQKYRVKINVNRKSISLGCVNTVEEATKLRIDAEIKYWGFQKTLVN